MKISKKNNGENAWVYIWEGIALKFRAFSSFPPLVQCCRRCSLRLVVLNCCLDSVLC